MENPYIVDFENNYYSHKVNGMDINETVKFALKQGYDGVIAKNIKDPGDMGDKQYNTNNTLVSATDYIVFSPAQIKSADPITYDNEGNIIPISQRFNFNSSDIRYSLSTPSSITGAAPSFVDPARKSVTLQSSNFKPSFKDRRSDSVVASQIAFTNAQAGLERLMREVGISQPEAEAMVQYTRIARAQANNIIGGKFVDISGNNRELKVLGVGLVEALSSVMPNKFTKDGNTEAEQTYTDFQLYRLHQHNISRMSLEENAKKKYLPQDIVANNLKGKAKRLRGTVKQIQKLQGEISVYRREGEKFKGKVEHRVKRIEELYRTLMKELSIENIEGSLTITEDMLKGITEVTYTPEEIKALGGVSVAGLSDADKAVIDNADAETNPNKYTEHLESLAKVFEALANVIDNNTAPLKEVRNKPLLGKSVMQKKIDPAINEVTEVEIVEPMTAAESQQLAEEYKKKYKGNEGFWKADKELSEYINNLMQFRVETGLVTEDMASSLSAMYPNYVPGYRVDSSSGLMVVKGNRAIEFNKTVQKATGSIKQIQPLHESMIEQTLSTIRSGRINQLMATIYEKHLESTNENKEKHFKIVERVPVRSSDPITAEELYEIDYSAPEKAPKENQVTFYYKGEKITVEVSKDVFAGIKDLAGRREGGLLDNAFGKLLESGMSTFRAVTTNYNPFFILRNLLKDLGDAALLSDSPIFTAYYLKAIGQMSKNSDMWQLYVANGGLGNTYFDQKKLKLDTKASARGFHFEKNWKMVGSAIEVANQFVEQIPRFTAFLISMNKGATVAEAMNAAAEITTNFQRGGLTTKAFNRSLIPFLNASVQGALKIPRRILSIFRGEETFKSIATLLFKCAVLGIAPIFLNALLASLFGEEEEYEKLRSTDKENYFIIPMGDGQFIKIPRGRIQAALASVTNFASGKSTAKDAWTNVSSQVSPWGTMTRTIFSPFKDVATNTTWYGGEIEGQQFENVRPSQRKDESTSSLAVGIADALSAAGIEYSPKKIHYLIDQYSGFFGDVVLDATTQRAKGNALVSNFTVDSVTSNKLSTVFYKYYNEAQYAKNEGDETAIYQLKFLNKIKSEVRDLYDQKSVIQSDSTLSSKEKLAQTRTLQALINGYYSAALDNFSTVTEASVMTSGYGLEESERFREVIRLSFGAESAFKTWNEKVYEKAQAINLGGIDYETYYDFYFAASKIESQKDKNGETVSGSKKAQTVKLIKAMKISDVQKLLLLTSSGYSISDSEFNNWSKATAKNKLLKYIFSLNVSKSEKERIAEICGFTVKNNRVIMK